MATAKSGPTRNQVKRGIEQLIRGKSDILDAGRNTLIYRIRKFYGWPIQSSNFMPDILRNKALGEVIELTDRSGKPISKLTVSSVKSAAGCHVLTPLSNESAVPAKQRLETTVRPQTGHRILAEKPSVTTVPLLPPRPDPTAKELLDMIVLHLWLTYEAEIRDHDNVEAKLARELGFNYARIKAVLEKAVDIGLDTDRLDIWPQNQPVFRRIMVRQHPSLQLVDDLRKAYPFIAAGRPWPPRPPQHWSP